MRILLLCDGGGPIGVGHVIRSLALAEASVVAGHTVVVAGHFEGAFLLRQLARAPVELIQLAALKADDDLQPIGDLVRTLRPDVIHVDSYDVTDWFMGSFILSNMEDGSFGRRPADVVIDPTFGAERAPRPDDGSTLLLRGSRYTPIRRRVLDVRKSGEANVAQDGIAHDAAARSVLVVMGGTDPVGVAPVAVKLLAGTGLALDVTVIAVGEIAERVRAAAEGSSLSLSVLAPVDDLAALMVRQDLVVSAAGTSVWELCCLGVPMALVWAVGNQREGYDRVVAAGAAVGLGGPELRGDDLRGDEAAVELLRGVLTDSAARADLALAGHEIVDGLGAWRVVRTWEMARRSVPAVADPGRLVARAATLEDARLLWQWRNDPATRESSRSSDEVPWDDHLAWLGDSLERTDRLLLLVEDDAGPVGTVRWDLTKDTEGEREWEVSITVAPQRRRQSLARPLLRAGELALSEVALSGLARSGATGVTAYLAVVNVDNDASLRLFETSAYVPDAPPDHRGFMRFRKAAPVA